MPDLMSNDSMQVAIPGTGAFQFSGVRPEELGATEYTLVVIAVDRSQSVEDFDDALVAAIKKIVGACKKSPRAENLMIRIITFNHNLDEIHGFKTLNTIDVDDYKSLDPAGRTALYDAVYSGIGSILTYGKTLMGQDFDVNGALYIVTDGMDNESTMTPSGIADWIKKVGKNEEIESLVTVLVGVNLNEPAVKQCLEGFQQEAGLTKFIDIGDATEQKLAKLAEFVSQSISSQSQALGTGGSSQVLGF